MKEPRATPKTATALVPPLAALVLVVFFTALGFWQLDRADQKRALQASFENDTDYLPVDRGVAPTLYQPIVATGRYLNQRQFLIDNMVVDGRLGYFVITPLEYASNKPLLLVNRGWIPAGPTKDQRPSIAIGDARQTVKGRSGQLPRVAIRPGSALENAGDWPKLATYPTSGDLASELNREVLPFILLADPDSTTTLVRRWKPQEFGPMRHIGYAFQWFALALTVIVVTVVLYRKKRAHR